MSAPVRTAPPPAAAQGGHPAPAPPDRVPESRGIAHPDAVLVATMALVVAACMPLTRVFVGNAFLRPVVAAALLSLGVSWVARRLGAGPVTTLVGSALAWSLFVALAFLPETLWGGILPTWESLGAGRDLWLRGIELIRIRPSPAFAEAGMLLITTSGVWWVAHAIDGLVFRLQAPLRAIGMALVLWSVPLAMARGGSTAWAWAAPLLAAAALLLLAFGGADLGRWGTRVQARGSDRGPDHATSAGAVIAGVAIVAGGFLGGLLPGFDDPPFYEVRSLGGTTITTNPIVSIRANLVNQSPNPIARVRTPEPVYLRLTALDVYGEREEWTKDGIRGGPASGRLAPETDMPLARDLQVEVTAEGLDTAIIVPVPYQPLELSGPVASGFQYDRVGATVTLAAGEGLERGDTYVVRAGVPSPTPEMLAAAPVGDASPALTALPGNVPEEVVDLARRIVADAGAATAFEQALAIQNELRSWTYSLDPPQGHSGNAMLAFIDSRVGYCEQFAGTMAVMLRSLGIPARVAVGFTPGELVDGDGEVQEWLVTQANAHAWVEVLFPGAGWVSFEPTPRDDGNLLTPSAANLAPSTIDAQQAAEPAPDDLSSLEDQGIDDLVPDVGDTGGGADPRGAGPGAGPDTPWTILTVLLALLAVALVAGAARTSARRRVEQMPPHARVLRAVERVCKVGRGLGRGPREPETDREYLRRLSGSTPAANGLAELAARARYAPALPADAGDDADRSADALVGGLLERLPAWRRALVRLRGPLAGARAAVWDRLVRGDDGTDWQQSAERLSRLVRRRSGR